MSVLESVGAAMPGIGFLLGGVVAAVASPRTTFLVAGLGIFAIRRRSPRRSSAERGAIRPQSADSTSA